MSKTVETWREQSPTLTRAALQSIGDVLADEVEKLEEKISEIMHGETMSGSASCRMRKAAGKGKVKKLEARLKAIAECSDMREMYRIARGE